MQTKSLASLFSFSVIMDSFYLGVILSLHIDVNEWVTPNWLHLMSSWSIFFVIICLCVFRSTASEFKMTAKDIRNKKQRAERFHDQLQARTEPLQLSINTYAVSTSTISVVTVDGCKYFNYQCSHCRWQSVRVGLFYKNSMKSIFGDFPWGW